ncbi:DUF397 domain-containing protein [Kitasatospora nipponensis]|uniref:DUF397 domain-containing protein n=1 Tax=Kitasatospora nipponensis TaxID=258049 RepID=A0ABN1W0H8_9ACTN
MSVEQPVRSVPEVAWFKSSYSSGAGGECIEVAAPLGAVHVRDSKDQAGPVLSFGGAEWAAFVGFVVGREA